MIRKISNKSLIIILISLICFHSINGYANPTEKLQDTILLLNKKLSDTEKEIKSIDLEIAEKAEELNKVNQSLITNNTKKNQLQSEKLEKLDEIDKIKQQLINNIENTYILHRNKLNNFNNINNTQDLTRIINYLDVYNNTTNDNINKIKIAITNIESLDQELYLINKQLITDQRNILVSQKKLNKLKSTNIALKNKLSKELKINQQKLNYYYSNYTNLNESLENNAGNAQTEIKERFTTAKGKLIMPVNGVIDTEFKQSNDRQAIFIKTDEGKPVKAVFNGKVIFSNWLRGFGFLTIINHSDGYMTLYGHNQTLHKKTGDYVEAGEVIATTGSSGGINQVGLYFEIRHNGAAVNPLAWVNTSLKSSTA